MIFRGESTIIDYHAPFNQGFMPLKGWSGFCFSWGYLLICARSINTHVWQAMIRVLLSLKNCKMPTIISHKRKENCSKTHFVWSKLWRKKIHEQRARVVFRPVTWHFLNDIFPRIGKRMENATARHCCLGIWQGALNGSLEDEWHAVLCMTLIVSFITLCLLLCKKSDLCDNDWK